MVIGKRARPFSPGNIFRILVTFVVPDSDILYYLGLNWKLPSPPPPDETLTLYVSLYA